LNGNGSTPVLTLQGVSKSFGPVQALSAVDFEVHQARSWRWWETTRGQERRVGEPVERD
jgi:hypothetical protein